MVLKDLAVGSSATVVEVNLPESEANRLMAMGFIPGAEVKCVRRSPFLDPRIYAVDGSEVALRNETASALVVETGALT